MGKTLTFGVTLLVVALVVGGTFGSAMWLAGCFVLLGLAVYWFWTRPLRRSEP